MTAQLGRPPLTPAVESAKGRWEADDPGFRSRVQALLDAHPKAKATLEVRGVVAWSGEALVRIPFPESGGSAEEAEAAQQAGMLERELRLADPGCKPLRRNPASLVRALLEMGSEGQLVEALRLVRLGCEAALDEKRRFYPTQAGDDHEELQRPGKAVCHARDRWVTPGLIDRLHAAVARVQGCAPWEADGTRPDGAAASADYGDYGSSGVALQPELRRSFEAIERYLDIDLPGDAWRAGTVDLARPSNAASDAVVNGEWAGDPPHAVRAPGHDAPRHMSGEELFAQMVETAIRR